MSTEKQDLFGAVSLRPRPRGSALEEEDIHLLSSPLILAVNVLCSRHFPVFPISEDGRNDLLVSSGQVEPTSWTGKYFEVSGCPFCTPDGRFESPVLKDFRSS